MRRTLWAVPLLIATLVGCGGGYQQPRNPNTNPPAPDPCVGSDFTVTYSPTTSTFVVNKGQSVTLRASVSISCPDTAKVRFTFSASEGISVMPNTIDVTGGREGSVTVRLEAGTSTNRPFFTVSAQGLDKNNDKRGQELYPTTFQWTAQ